MQKLSKLKSEPNEPLPDFPKKKSKKVIPKVAKKRSGKLEEVEPNKRLQHLSPSPSPSPSLSLSVYLSTILYLSPRSLPLQSYQTVFLPLPFFIFMLLSFLLLPSLAFKDNLCQWPLLSAFTFSQLTWKKLDEVLALVFVLMLLEQKHGWQE